jgi:serine/threonine protein kinase
MVHRDPAAADPFVPTPPGVPVDSGSPGESIPVGRILAGGLRVLGRLGSTPEGPLYQAEYLNGVEAALVVLRSEGVGGEPPRRERFSRARQIQHPNVAAVYEVGEMEDGSVYVVLEQPVGEPLSDLLAAGQVFALTEALDLALQAAAGLQEAHRAGFVHGSVSPQTILVTRAAYGQLQVKLIGFTLDPASRQQGTKPPIPEEASAGYASPERLVGHPPDERSDVFSLGAVLHHLLTGMPPDGSRVDRSVPRLARAVLDTALTPAPARRFQTISELDEALRQVASVAANPKRGMIHRARLIGAMAAGLALVTGGIWLLPGSNRRATIEERSAPPPAPVRARSPAPAPPVARQNAPRIRNGPAASETDRSIETGTVATPPAKEPPPLPTNPIPAEGSGRMEQPDDPLSDDQTMYAHGDPPRSRSTPAPTPAAVEKLKNRQTEESPETSEALGYVGESALSSVPNLPPDSTPASEPRQPRATPPIRTFEDPRPRDELARDQGLRQSIGDVMRLGVAADVAEIRAGSLLVSLTPDAMHVPSVMYNLQRLYLAYSAATEYRDEVALELRHGRDLYGWFTRDGLTQARLK